MGSALELGCNRRHFCEKSRKRPEKHEFVLAHALLLEWPANNLQVISMNFIDQELGYAGQDRFVFFYYEPRRREVWWKDTRSCGSGSAGWPAPFANIEADARAFGITLGHNVESGDHVILVDRIEHRATIAYREEAQEFLARQSAMAA